MFVVFDLDGTLANIDHRLKYIQDGRNDWESFFEACDDDLLNENVAKALHAHRVSGHKVEIWSARSAVVKQKTQQWLIENNIGSHRLTHMRPEKCTVKDTELKRSWLYELHPEERPDIVYDDRQSVVDMWREEGISCFQVTADWENKKKVIERKEGKPSLDLLIGPSGAGKTHFSQNFKDEETVEVLSSDFFRRLLTGSVLCQDRNDDVFQAMRNVAKARIDSGLDVMIDATNIRRKDRRAFTDLANENTQISYIIIDRPLEEKIANGGWRNEVTLKDGKTLVQSHHERFQSALPHILKGDGNPKVAVVDLRGKI